MNCPACGAVNEGQAKFCKKCGHALAQAAPAQKVAVDPAQGATAASGLAGAAGGITGALAAAGTLSSGRAGKKKDGTLEVHDKVVRFDDSVIAAKHIEFVSSHIPKPPLPKLALLLLLVSIVLFFIMLPIGVVCLVASCAWLGSWAIKRVNPVKGITFYLNSMRSITIYFSDHALADQLLDALEAALSEGAVDMSFELPADARIDVDQGDAGGLAKRLGA